MRAIKMPAGLASDEQLIWNKEMIPEIYRDLNDFDETLESKRDRAYRNIICSQSRESRIEARQKLAGLTASRSPAFVRDLERLKGLRDD